MTADLRGNQALREVSQAALEKSTGQGHFNVFRVIADTAIAERLWELKQAAIPKDPKAHTQWLDNTWDEIAALVQPLTDHRLRLKMYRVFA